MVNEDIGQDVNPLLERVWEIVDMLAALPTPESLTSAEQEVLSDIEKLRIIAIQCMFSRLPGMTMGLGSTNSLSHSPAARLTK